MNKFKSFFYDRVPPEVMNRWWHAVAYYDPMTRKLFMVIWPFHWAVQLYRWIEWKWDEHRHRPGWIDRHTKAAIKNHFNNPWC